MLGFSYFIPSAFDLLFVAFFVIFLLAFEWINYPNESGNNRTNVNSKFSPLAANFRRLRTSRVRVRGIGMLRGYRHEHVLRLIINSLYV